MKKIVCFISFLCLLTLCFSCSRVNEGPMENLIGTYQLTEYYRVMNDETEEKEATRIQFFDDKEIEMFLVITGNELGYISYKDNQTTLFIKEVKLEYTYDTENTDYIRSVSYTLANEKEDELIQNGWKNLGFVDSEHSLNISDPKINVSGCGTGNVKFTTEYRDIILFNRVSRDIDTKYIQEKYDSDIKIQSYALSKVQDNYVCPLYILNENDIPASLNDFIFKAYEIDVENKTAKYYYATKEEKILKVEENIPVEFTVSSDKMSVESIKIKDDVLTNEYESYLLKGDNGGEEKSAFFYNILDDMNEFCQNQINDYIQREVSSN